MTASGFGSQFKNAGAIVESESDTRAAGSCSILLAPRVASDWSVSYSLTAFQTMSFDNIMEVLDRTGLGSIDIVSTVSAPPLVTTRVFNHAGTAGTSGFTEDVQDVADALELFDFEYYTRSRRDLTNYRVNVGIQSGRAARSS